MEEIRPSHRHPSPLKRGGGGVSEVSAYRRIRAAARRPGITFQMGRIVRIERAATEEGYRVVLSRETPPMRSVTIISWGDLERAEEDPILAAELAPLPTIRDTGDAA